MCIDFRKNKIQPDPVCIKGNEIERVGTYKYLGVWFDNVLSWTQNTNATVRKAHSRLFCLRKLRSFDVRQELLQIFYFSSISSVLVFGLTCWGGNISKQDKGRLDKIIKKAGSVVGRTQDNLDVLYERRLTKKLTDILHDQTHPLRQEFDSRIIERSGRMRVPKTRTARCSNSFVPRAISFFNSRSNRC